MSYAYPRTNAFKFNGLGGRGMLGNISQILQANWGPATGIVFLLVSLFASADAHRMADNAQNVNPKVSKDEKAKRLIRSRKASNVAIAFDCLNIAVLLAFVLYRARQ